MSKRKPLKRLTPQHIKFCEKYILLYISGEKNAGKQAAETSNYSKKSSDTIASNLLSDPLIKNYIDNRAVEIQEDTRLDQLKLIQVTKDVANANFKDIAHFDGDHLAYKSFDELTRSETAAITSVKRTERTTESGEIIETVEMKLSGQETARNRLAKFFEMGSETVNIKAEVNNSNRDLSEYTDDELDAIINHIVDEKQKNKGD